MKNKEIIQRLNEVEYFTKNEAVKKIVVQALEFVKKQ